MDTPTVEILGRTWPVKLPDMATREELGLAWYQAERVVGKQPFRLCRVAAAALGLCTTGARDLEVSYTGLGCDVLAYGGAVYDRLREAGAEPLAIVQSGRAVMMLVAANRTPRPSEVEAGKAGSPATQAG